MASNRIGKSKPQQLRRLSAARHTRAVAVRCVTVWAMVSFSLTFEPGTAVYEQVVYAGEEGNHFGTNTRRSCIPLG
jgi:hypothetical protein